MEVKQMHLNKPQLRSMAIGAPTEIAVFGRGTGKTVGILAPKTANSYFGTMPRGSGVILSRTYAQCFGNTLPELIRGWQMFGYQYDHHFLVGKKPSEKWKKMWRWKEPYAPPMDYKYVVTWFNGAVAQIISQERPGSSNGKSIDWIAGDELKLINEEKLRTELLPANRGIVPAFADNPYHHGMTFTTDMPIGTAGRWILEYADKMDREKINQVWQIQMLRFQLTHALKKETRKTFQEELNKQISVLDAELHDLRKNLLYYHEASTLDNIHALGIDYIKQQLRDTTPFQFDTQILNLRPLRLEDGFYPDFDEEIHGYFAENHNYFNNYSFDPFNVKMDCRKDSDLLPNAPLHIAMDPNRRIHAISVGQVTNSEIKSIKGIHSLYPDKLKKAVQDFCDYYKPHKRKFVYYWYDQTSYGDMFETRICEDVVSILRKNDWVVKEMYLGAIPGHEERYRMWGDLSTNNGKYNRTYSINRENCKHLILSKQQAAAKKSRDGFEKNKKSEHDAKFPAEESTHYSDAEDTWVFGVLESGMAFGNESKGTGGIIT
jgi:hypothetical protein